MPVTHPHPMASMPEVFLHARAGHRDADPIEIGNGKQQNEQTHDAATIVRRARHDGGLCHG